MDPISIGAIVAGAKTGLAALKDAAETITAIRTAARGPEGHKSAEVDVKRLSDLAESLIEARIRTLDIVNVVETLHEENRGLRESLARKEQFSERSAKYVLRRVGEGAVFYEYTQAAGDTTPVHSVCANCFEGEKISHLQPDFVGFGTTDMKCSNCGAKVSVPNGHRGEAHTVRVQKSPNWSPHDF